MAFQREPTTNKNVLTMGFIVTLVIVGTNGLSSENESCTMKGINRLVHVPLDECDLDRHKIIEGDNFINTTGALNHLRLTLCLDHSKIAVGQRTGVGVGGGNESDDPNPDRILFMEFSRSEAELRGVTSLKVKVIATSEPSQCLQVELNGHSENSGHVGHQRPLDVSLPIRLLSTMTEYIVQITSTDAPSLQLTYGVKVDSLHPNAWLSPAIAVTSFAGKGYFTISAPSITKRQRHVSYSAFLIHCWNGDDLNFDQEEVISGPVHKSSDRWGRGNCEHTVDERHLDFDVHSDRPLEVVLNKGDYQLWVDAEMIDHAKGYVRRSIRTPTFYIPEARNWSVLAEETSTFPIVYTETENRSRHDNVNDTFRLSTLSTGSANIIDDWVMPAMIGLAAALVMTVIGAVIVCVKKKYYGQLATCVSAKTSHPEMTTGYRTSNGQRYCPVVYRESGYSSHSAGNSSRSDDSMLITTSETYHRQRYSGCSNRCIECKPQYSKCKNPFPDCKSQAESPESRTLLRSNEQHSFERRDKDSDFEDRLNMKAEYKNIQEHYSLSGENLRETSFHTSPTADSTTQEVIASQRNDFPGKHGAQNVATSHDYSSQCVQHSLRLLDEAPQNLRTIYCNSPEVPSSNVLTSQRVSMATFHEGSRQLPRATNHFYPKHPFFQPVSSLSVSRTGLNEQRELSRSAGCITLFDSSKCDDTLSNAVSTGSVRFEPCTFQPPSDLASIATEQLQIEMSSFNRRYESLS